VVLDTDARARERTWPHALIGADSPRDTPMKLDASTPIPDATFGVGTASSRRGG
jgi:hypothetical protein